MREYDERPEGPEPWDDDPVELIAPEDFLGPDGVPLDARLMGFDRNTEEGALIALAGSLDPGKALAQDRGLGPHRRLRRPPGARHDPPDLLRRPQRKAASPVSACPITSWCTSEVPS